MKFYQWNSIECRAEPMEEGVSKGGLDVLHSACWHKIVHLE